MPTGQTIQIKSPADLPPTPKQSMLHKLAVSMMSDPGLSPMGLGVVVGSKGGQALADTLASEADDLTPLTAVKRYMELKYPKLMSKVPIFLRPDMPPEQAGQFVQFSDPSYNKIHLNVNHPMTQSPLPLTNVIGHEITHGAIQAERTPQLIGSQYIPAPRGVFTADNPQFLAYYNQPAEVNARQGGATAANTLLNFIQQYPAIQKLFGPMLQGGQ